MMFRRFGLVLTSLLLLAVMATQLVHLASFELRRMSLRKEMKHRIRQGLPQAELVRFTFTVAEYAALEKEDDGKEFWVDGHIYDVVRISSDTDGSFHIEAVDDRDEARLMADLQDLLKDGMEQRGLGRGRALNVVASLATALPEDRQTLLLFPVLEGVMAPYHRTAVLDQRTPDLLRPPRG